MNDPVVEEKEIKSKKGDNEQKQRSSSSPARDVTSSHRKQVRILKVLANSDLDESRLRQLAISQGGILTNELRIKAWPKLLGVNVDEIEPKPDIDVLHGHRDYSQVVLDVNRSLKRFPPGMEEDVRLSLQDQLVDSIMRVLVAVPELHYYQGYHDIVVTILLVADEDLTFALMKELSTNHLRCFMDHNMDRTKHILNYLYPILGRSCPELREYMERAEVGTIFCLSWLITWFGHVLSDLKHIVRLYDYFIASHRLMPIYLAAAVVLHRSEEVLAAECEMPIIHSLLSRIPQNLPFEELASHAGDLFIQFPPKVLEVEAQMIADKQRAEAEAFARERTAMQERRSQYQASQRSYLPVLPYGSMKAFFKVTATLTTLTLATAALAIFGQEHFLTWFQYR